MKLMCPLQWQSDWNSFTTGNKRHPKKKKGDKILWPSLVNREPELSVAQGPASC